MTHWCKVSITVQGNEKEEIDLFIEAVKGPDAPFDFQVIQPIPDLVQNLGTGKKTFNLDGQIVPCLVWYLREGPDGKAVEQRPLSATEQNQLKVLGVTSYADWIDKNWGCKWNAPNGDIHRCSNTEVSYQFETPWAPPTPLLRGLRDRFTDLKIIGKFVCPKDQWAGYF